MVVSPFKEYVMAVDRVERRLKRVTEALNAARIQYAAIGGNAVAVWVASIDQSATRSTVDVEHLIDDGDLKRVSAVFAGLGFERHDLRRLILFTDPEEPSRRSGVHLVWAGRKVLPSYAHPAPDVNEAVLEPGRGFWVLGLPALVRMKLTSIRDIDRVHIADMLGVGLIDDKVRQVLPPDLRERLQEIENGMDDFLA